MIQYQMISYNKILEKKIEKIKIQMRYCCIYDPSSTYHLKTITYVLPVFCTLTDSRKKIPEYQYASFHTMIPPSCDVVTSYS